MGSACERSSLRPNEFGLLLRALRENACLTQEELAERSGVSVRAISNLECGRTGRPHRKSVNLLAEALRMRDDASERFRQVARRPAVAPPGPAHPLAGPEPLPSQTCHRGEPWRGGRSALIEWMRQILVEEPVCCREEDPGSHGFKVVQLISDSETEKAAVVVRASAYFHEYFPDGRFYVDVGGGARGPAALVDRLSHLLGVAPGPWRPLDQQVLALRDTVRSRRVLLVLDNVADAEQVRPLLPVGGGSAAIVIASRGLDLFEGVWTVDVRSGHHGLTTCGSRAAVGPGRPEANGGHRLAEGSRRM
ncbi:helix-turn-helix domain-containing protein [Streptosporangium sp. DT93]|uniref:helix-turn-helix domain-containing protein n=1 Tax=Streptosporangium sp. DT93 TaxID=3393428 RepID=UPI003CEC8755